MAEPRDIEQLKQQLHQCDDAQLQQQYQRGLPIDSLAALLAGSDSEEVVVRVMRWVLRVDPIRGIALTQAIRPRLQTKAFALVGQLKIPLPLKIRLLGRTRSPRLIPWLLKGLQHDSGEVNAWSAWALVQIGYPAEPHLMGALGETAPSARVWAVWALGQIGSDRAIAGLIKALNHDDPQVRWRAATALGNLKSSAAIAPLERVLANDGDRYVRGRAATALGLLDREEVIPQLEAALDDPNFYVNANAVYGLSAIGTPAAWDVLIRALNHPNGDVRTRAIEVLAKSDRETTWEAILDKLDDPDPYVRAKVLETFQFVRTAEALAGIKRAIDDPDPYVQSIAQTIVDRLNEEVAEASIEMAGDRGPESCHPLLPKLWISSRLQLENYIVHKNRGANVEHIISIVNSGGTLPTFISRVPHRLKLEFDDIHIPDSDPQYILPQREHVIRAIEFMETVDPDGGDLLVHCQMGIRRSPAIALAACASRLPPGLEDRAFACVTDAQPQASPNPWIVELADMLLRRGGRLMRVVE